MSLTPPDPPLPPADALVPVDPPAPPAEAPVPAEAAGGDEPAEPAEPPPEPAAEPPQERTEPPQEHAEPPPNPARQLSLFGVEAADPSVGDLAGLLAGPGELVRMGGTARITVVVDAAWRVHVLVAELARRGLTANWLGRMSDQRAADGVREEEQPGTQVVEPRRTAESERHGVRTSYSTLLAPLGAAWLRGTVKRPPANFFLTGPRLRLWTAAAGTPEPLGFLLRLGAADEACWEPVGAALAAIGLPAVLLDTGAGGPAYRITGRRRLARLAELVGDRPPAAPPGRWPEGAARVPSIG